jgi:hypothetical protein
MTYSRAQFGILIAALAVLSAAILIPYSADAALVRSALKNEFLTDTSGSFSVTTTSFTPPADSLLVAVVGVFATGEIEPGLALSGGGLTWTRRAIGGNSGAGYDACGIQIWTAVATSTASKTLTISDGTSVSDAGATIQILAYTGYDHANPIGKTVGDDDIGTNGAGSMMLSGSPLLTSAVVASRFFVVNGSNPTTATPGSGWEEVYETPSGTAGYGDVETQERTASTSASVFWTDIHDEATGIYCSAASGAAIEVRARVTVNKPPNNLGLVGYWSFDEGTSTIVTDFSGNGNHGTLAGSSGGLPQWVNGKRGKAIDFDGSDDRVATVDINSTDNATALTVAVWLKADNIASDYSTISKFTGGSGNWDMWFSSRSPCNLQGLAFSSDGTGGGNESCATGNLHQAGVWEHWVVVFDGTLSGDANRLKMYKDGAQATIDFGAAIPATLPSNSASITFGNTADLSGNYFPGSFDEVRIYNRALSASEIAALYNSGAVKFTTSSVTLQQGSTLSNGLRGHWTFDGGDTNWTSTTAGTTRDASGNNNTGTMTNMSRDIVQGQGKLGQAFNFDGSNDEVNVGSGTSIDGLATTTIAAWIYLDSFGEGNEGRIYAKGELDFVVWDDGGPCNRCLAYLYSATQDFEVYSTSNAISTGQWYHVAVTRDGSFLDTGVQFYVNGSPLVFLDDGDPDGTGDYYADVDDDALIGNHEFNNFAYDGKIDDLRVYNRVLTAAEVKQLYNLGRATIRP